MLNQFFKNAVMGAVFALFTSSAIAEPGLGQPNPVLLYGDTIKFDVLRDGDKVGTHNVRFEKDGADLRVKSEFEVKIDLMFVTVFRFEYRSEGLWREKQLHSLVAHTNDNGKKHSVAAERRGDFIDLTGPSADEVSVPGSIMPTNHWNPAVLRETRVLNTLTGEIDDVRIVQKGLEPVETERGTIQAMRYSYTGDLKNDVWYDDAGRWVKMRFKGQDDSSIDYVCRRCQGSEQTVSTE
jgi:hypothetical protein